ncbi:hypothetical protein IEO70_16685 [Bacillus sp. AGMB 02131]|uniref:Linear amide C-N hydrolase n=1 Tax=Peribacillus faecalis TaxID=2772559 RepID=A0A927CYF5_9BACI|nr:hypothetical protein [Peribacillus faecalis]MBD3109978.1 hypothetical protein [Peribacillus faecalis]
MDLGTYTHIDDESQIAYWNARYDGFTNEDVASTLCSCCIKPVVENGENVTLFGRSQDLPSSYYPAFVLRVNEPGKYRSLGIGYTHTGGFKQTFDQIVETGVLAKEVYDVVPYLITDALNEKGLMLESNMRGDCHELDCPGTNPGAPLRMSTLNVVRYFADHCATIDDVLAACEEIDMYTPHSKVTSWHIAIAMMDATGRYGVLEFAKNKPIWHESQPGQCNFWIDQEAYNISDGSIGLGRWAALMEHYDDISCFDDMAGCMKNVWYSQLFGVDPKGMSFDPVTENVDMCVQDIIDQAQGWVKNFGITIDSQELAVMQSMADEQAREGIRWTTSYVLAPQNRYKANFLTRFVYHCLNQMPMDGLKRSGMDECSCISYVVRSNERVIRCRFFEQDEWFDLTL